MFLLNSARAQNLELQLEVVSTAPAKLIVNGKFLAQPNSGKISASRWLFLDNYADATDLSRRFSKQEFFDETGKTGSVNKASNEFVTKTPAVSWRYEVSLETPSDAAVSAHVSWLQERRGLLMLSDLLPQIENAENLSALVKISLPADWKIATVEPETGANEFSVADVEKAVFLVGKDFSQKTGWIGKTEFRLASEGKWSFADEEVVTMASQIFEEHRRTFGEAVVPKFQMILLPLPAGAKFDRWRAETRGSTIVLLSAVNPFKSLALNRLHEQLRHEIFHFWIPNGLNLSGNYDWFYEGFTLYQALKTGVRLDYIRFEDFLNTMSRAIDAAQAAQAAGKISLLDASRERWRGGANLVYAKGMGVAFLCDAALLSETGGRESLGDVFRQLYQKHNFAKPRVDGNQALLQVLKKNPRLAQISERLIEGAETIDVKNLGELSGLVNLSQTGFTKLAVSRNLNGRQKKVLEKLGLKDYELKLGKSE